MPESDQILSVPHAASPVSVCELLRVDAKTGLTDAEAAVRAQRFGENRLPEPPPTSELRRILHQLESPLVLVLLVSAAIATAVGWSERSGSLFMRFGDALSILIIVFLNALLGYIQEHRAESALRALSRFSVPQARVVRGGVLKALPATALVPGDIVELRAGDAVPADVRLLDTTELEVDESALTGESTAVVKGPAAVPAPAPLAERASMAYLGTLAVHGKGRAAVVATGTHTELGRIALLLGTTSGEETPLEATLGIFGRRVLWLCIFVSALLFVWAILRGGSRWHLALLQCVSFGVALIPEGLPAITAIALGLGTQRMARRGVIIRRLPAVEALGATSVICADKTGTLTQNRMTVRALYIDGRRLDDAVTPSRPLGELLLTAALCNDAHLRQINSTGTEVEEGPATEVALLRAARSGGCDLDRLASEYPRIAELPFDSERKRMSVLTRASDRSLRIHVKGSVESVLPLCSRYLEEAGERPMTEADRRNIQGEMERMSAAAMRVLLLACRHTSDESITESELTFLGLVGMLDPPRSEVAEAIAACHRAGIVVAMITGDHPGTATAIAREIGVLRPGDEALTGAQLSELSDDALRLRCEHTRVFARTTADQKLRIVRAFQQGGQVVAMTGDGVNDAPALREAHVGIAMGRGGTEVARQAADVILTDDNFATIVAGIREGRAIYHNIQKFIVYLLSSNVALALAVFGTTFYRDALPLTALMILWINLVTNGLPALALGVEPPDPAQMTTAPRSAREGLFTGIDYLGIVLAGLVMGVLALGLYLAPVWGLATPEQARSMAFALLGFAPLFHVWNCRSRDRSLFAQRPLLTRPLLIAVAISAVVHCASLALPALRPLFKTYALSVWDWLVVLGLSFGVLPIIELAKLVGRPLLRRP